MIVFVRLFKSLITIGSPPGAVPAAGSVIVSPESAARIHVNGYGPILLSDVISNQ
jgi:hypothetical protein